LDTFVKPTAKEAIHKRCGSPAYRMRVSLGDTSAHRSLHLPADLCRSVSRSTLDTARRRGLVRCRVRPLAGSLARTRPLPLHWVYPVRRAS